MDALDNVITKDRFDEVLTESSHAFFQQNGFLILDGFANARQLKALKDQAEYHLSFFDPFSHRCVFQPGPIQDRYFLDSGDQIRCFLEPKAQDTQGNLTSIPQFSINKLGHALHDRDPVFEQFSYQSKFKKIAQWLQFQTPVIAQSMYIFKPPKIGAEVPWHQDATFIRTLPHSVIGLWLAIDDATVDNGCLWVIPGAHQTSIKQHYIRRDNKVSLQVEDDTPWPTSKKQALEVKAGTLILLHGQLPHMSSANRTLQQRHAYTMHFIEGEHPYPKDNWLQRGAEHPFQNLYTQKTIRLPVMTV